MDRQQMIDNLERLKVGIHASFEENVSLYAKNGKVYRGAEEIPLENLSQFKNAVRIMIVEGVSPEVLQKIKDDISPELIITEVRG